MSQYVVAVTVVLTAGVLLSVVVWQVLAIARDRVRGDHSGGNDELGDLRRRVQALEQQQPRDQSGPPPS